MTDSVVTALIKARDQIGRPGYFHKGSNYNRLSDETGYNHPCCIYGAVGFALNQNPGYFKNDSIGRRVIDLLREHIPDHLMHVSGQRKLSLIEYGDRATTSQGDVVALFNRAIDARALCSSGSR